MVERIDRVFHANGIACSVPVPGLASDARGSSRTPGSRWASPRATEPRRRAPRSTALGSRHYLPHVFGYDSVPRPKPAPDIVLCLLQGDRRAAGRDRGRRRQSARPRDGAERRRRRRDRRADRQQRPRRARAARRRGARQRVRPAGTGCAKHARATAMHLRSEPVGQPPAPDRQRHQRAAQPGRERERRDGKLGEGRDALRAALRRLRQELADERRERHALPGIAARRPDARQRSRARREAAAPSPRRCRPSHARSARRQAADRFPEDADARTSARRRGSFRHCSRRRRRPAGRRRSCASSGRRSGCRPPTGRPA